MKLFATDLDGTLLDNNHHISHENVVAIKEIQSKGIEVVPSTGRSFLSTVDILSKVNIKPKYIISCNGALVHTINGEKLKSAPLNIKNAEEFFKYIHNNKYCYCAFTEDTMFLKDDNIDLAKADYALAHLVDPNVKIEMLEDLIQLFSNTKNVIKISHYDEILNSEKEIFSINAISLNKLKLKKGIAETKHIKNTTVSSSAYNNFDAVHEEASKGTALEFLSNYLSIPLCETMAIGDNLNDLSMLNIAGKSIAMGNSSDDIKKVCTYSTLKNTESGVAEAINNYILNKF